jgi:multidrug efflux pump subunit AcrA (membrane-fusion protein)
VTITQLDPIAVGFNLPQRNLADVLQALRSGGGSVLAVLPEGRGTLTGRLQFVDNAVDAGSGTVRVKAQFTNADEKLWPGAFVNVRLAIQTLKDAVVLPQAAIHRAARQIVYVVDAGNKARRDVQVTYRSAGSGRDRRGSGRARGRRRAPVPASRCDRREARADQKQRARRGAGLAPASSAAGATGEAVPGSGPAAGAAPLAMSSGVTP